MEALHPEKARNVGIAAGLSLVERQRGSGSLSGRTRGGSNTNTSPLKFSGCSASAAHGPDAEELPWRQKFFFHPVALAAAGCFV